MMKSLLCNSVEVLGIFRDLLKSNPSEGKKFRVDLSIGRGLKKYLKKFQSDVGVKAPSGLTIFRG